MLKPTTGLLLSEKPYLRASVRCPGLRRRRQGTFAKVYIFKMKTWCTALGQRARQFAIWGVIEEDDDV